MNDSQQQPRTRQELISLFDEEKYNVEEDILLSHEDIGKADLVIKNKNNNKKYHLVFKNDPIKPASFADALRLFCAKTMEKEKNNDYEYGIYCTRTNNIMAEKTAEEYNVTYHQNFDNLVNDIRHYLK